MPTNLDRAEWAAAALRHFQCTTGTDYDDALTDLLCDLHHWCDRENVNFQAALDRGRQHYDTESSEEIAADIRLDTYLLSIAPTDLSVKLIENASATHAALEQITRHATLGIAANELGKQLNLDQILSIARAVLARMTGGVA
jgi:hypothetical protein